MWGVIIPIGTHGSAATIVVAYNSLHLLPFIMGGLSEGCAFASAGGDCKGDIPLCSERVLFKWGIRGLMGFIGVLMIIGGVMMICGGYKSSFSMGI